jgi:alpha-amylase
VRDYLIENAKGWIKETKIDGFRLDTVRHVPNEFWEFFIGEIKGNYPDFYLLGEVWHHNAKVLKVYQNLGMDGITNYSLYEGIRGAFGPYSDMKDFSKLIRDESTFTDPTLNSVFIDNHDNPRFYESGEEFSLDFMKQALAFVYTYPAVSTVYYETESMLEGSYDPVNRGFMPWDSEGDLFEYVKWLSELKAIYTGSLEVVSYEWKHFAYKIVNSDNEMLIIMNTDMKDSIVEFSFEGKLTDYANGDEIHANGTINLPMEPVSIIFFVID